MPDKTNNKHTRSRSYRKTKTLTDLANKKSESLEQDASSKSEGGVYDFEFVNGENWSLNLELSPIKVPMINKKKTLAQNALKNLRNEVTQKSKRAATKTKSKRPRSSPKESAQSAKGFQSHRTSTKRPREISNMVSHSTQTPPKRRKLATKTIVETQPKETSEKILGGCHAVADKVFMSPPSLHGLLKKTNTSTPSDVTLSTPNIILRSRNVEHNESLYERDCILAGAPDLSPVAPASATYESDEEQVNMIIPEYVEVERPKPSNEEEEEEEETAYRTLSISKLISKCTGIDTGPSPE